MPPESAHEATLEDDQSRLAITGVTGFIGSAVAAHFVASGWRVRALVRDAARAAKLVEDGVEAVLGDLADTNGLAELVEGASAVVHCAGAVRGVTDEDFRKANAEGVANVASAAAFCSPQPLMVALSSLAARKADASPYAASKRQGELVLADAAGDMPWIVLRPPAVYGPGDRASLPLLRSLVRGLVLVPGDPRNRFSLIYVDDLVTAIAACVAAGRQAAGGVFELHDGRPRGYDWYDLREIGARCRGGRVRMLVVAPAVLSTVAGVNVALSRVTGRAPLLTPGKVGELTHPDWVCDNSALTAACGWTPRVEFGDGLRLTLAAESRKRR